MELMFVALGGVLFGAVVRYVLPGRETSGALLLPAVGVVAACVTWAILTWAGLAFDGGWIWFLSLAVAVSAPLLTAVALPRRRKAADARLLASLNQA
ncbi:MAG: hypothetical protein H7146_08650 [Burkholderiaceae bacterium]|nr:hypothetical protein [Microbacteriaceae bacterium]